MRGASRSDSHCRTAFVGMTELEDIAATKIASCFMMSSALLAADLRFAMVRPKAAAQHNDG